MPVPMIAPEILILTPLAIAAGIDLYLTLLLIGAAPTLGFWPVPLPGALGDLDSPEVLIILGVLYLLEFAAERFSTPALAWGAIHAVIRPMSGALLALLLLDGHDPMAIGAGAIVAALLASTAHGMRSGASVLRWMSVGRGPSTLLVSLAEDILVVGLVTLSLDASPLAIAIPLIMWLLVLRETPSLLRAFWFAIWLGASHLMGPFQPKGWTAWDVLPDWVRRTLGSGDPLVGGGVLRGTRAAGWRLHGARRLEIGWIIAGAGCPIFLSGRGGSPRSIKLDGVGRDAVRDHGLFRRIDLTSDGLTPFLLIGSQGPGMESLRGEFDPLH